MPAFQRNTQPPHWEPGSHRVLTVDYHSFPELNLYCWNRHDLTLPAEDAFAVYVENWTSIDPNRLQVHELKLVRALNAQFGNLLDV